MHKYKRALLCWVFCVALISCAANMAFFTKGWGKITPDNRVRNNFETYVINPDMNYYLSGSDVYPFAILGLQKDYILDSTLWKSVEMTPAKMKELVADMQFKAQEISQQQYGFAVLDDRGGQIGIWYSLLTAATSVQMREGKKVLIHTPDPDTYSKFEEKPFRGRRR